MAVKSYFYQHDAMLAWLLAVVMCLCVSVTRQYCIEMAAWIELIFACRFPSICATMYFKEIRVPLKIRVLPSGTLSQTLDLENFTTAQHWSENVIYSDSGWCSVDSSAPGGDGLASVATAAYSKGL